MFMNYNINIIMKKLVDVGINPRVTMVLDRNHSGEYIVGLDLATSTKSGLYLFATGDEIYVTGRYDELAYLNAAASADDILDEILDIFADRYRSCKYGCACWLDLAVSRGVMSATTQTVTTYS